MAEDQHSGGHHFACTLSSVLVRRVRRTLGEEGLTQLLERAGSTRSLAYLDDVTNWISYDEAMGLFAAAAELTGDPHIARHAGEEAVAQHAGTPVATLMRSLGSPEAIYGAMAQAGSKFTTASVLEAVEVEPGRALIRDRAVDGFDRTISHCDWSKGLLSQPTCLFGLPPASVDESTCQARGDDACLYEITWNADLAAKTADPAEHVVVLEAQLSAMTERLDNVYATATDLIADSDLDAVLARITERAATAVRAPRYLLALRGEDDREIRCHHSGFDPDEANEIAERVLGECLDDLPDTWLGADVSSHRRAYGRLVAMGDTTFFPQERYLLDVYARYAAGALDGATALDEAKRGHAEAEALLELARRLADATTRDEVAARLAETVPEIVDCDRLSVWIWEPDEGALVSRARWGDAGEPRYDDVIRPEDTPYLAAQLDDPEPSPKFFDRDSDDDLIRSYLEAVGSVAGISAPIVARGEFLGVLSVGVEEDARRLRPNRDLIDRLSGIVAAAASALQTAALLDRVTYQARHDGLTGLANRGVFTEAMQAALANARATGESFGLLFVDLDDFKSVNDALGPGAGDELLCEVARRLTGCVRDDVVARLGGDEFGILLAGVKSPADADVAVDRVDRAFDDPFMVAGERLELSASVGRAVWPEDASELEALMRHADSEMYRAKRAGRIALAGGDGLPDSASATRR
jgi:diguanylate cyclase (GGDEF)-like protein